MTDTPEHRLAYAHPIMGRWVYRCECGAEFKDILKERAHGRFNDHIDEATEDD